MARPTLVIADVPVPFGAAWVHLKPRPHQPVAYEVCVPRELCQAIFDPGNRRPAGLSWPEFLWSETAGLGTFILDAWFEAMAGQTPAAARRWEWVIATVDRIRDEREGICLAGRAERFGSRRFA